MSNYICVICLDGEESGKMIKFCQQNGHYFHRECATEWRKKSKTCPICRCNDFTLGHIETFMDKIVEYSVLYQGSVLQSINNFSFTYMECDEDIDRFVLLYLHATFLEFNMNRLAGVYNGRLKDLRISLDNLLDRIIKINGRIDIMELVMYKTIINLKYQRLNRYFIQITDPKRTKRTHSI
jgi:hypothetical protein